MKKIKNELFADETDSRFRHMRDPFGKWNEKSPYSELLNFLTLTEDELVNYQAILDIVRKGNFEDEEKI